MRFPIHRKSRFIYITAGLLLLLLEIYIALYVHDRFVRPYLGDFLVVLLLYSFLMVISKLRVVTGILSVLVFSFLIELLQAVRFIEWFGLQDNSLARLVLGTSFSVMDLVMYSLGAIFIAGIEWLLKSQKPNYHQIS